MALEEFDISSITGERDDDDFKAVLAQDAGTLDSFRHSVLSMVVKGRYERAIAEIRHYGKSKKDFPDFERRSVRHFEYCIDLVNAIEAKREIDQNSSLSVSKRKELHDSALKHFRDLQDSLKKIEKIELDLRLSDVRTTVWVLRTASYCGAALIATAFFIKIWGGLGALGMTFIREEYGVFFDKLMTSLGL